MPEPGQIAVLIPIFALMIPIVGMLVRHQQRMAELMHSQRLPNPETEALRTELSEMKQLLHQQMIQVDTVLQLQRTTGIPNSQPSELANRLEG